MRGLKRGQADAANAATLVGLVAALIVLYILFIPPAEREKLLGNTSGTSDSGSESGTENSLVVLQEFPGRLDPEQKPEQHLIPNVNLIETTNARELDSFNTFQVRNGWFDKKVANISFSVPDIRNTDNVVLSFVSAKHQGVLSITLNGEPIYEDELLSDNPEPIRLRKELLKENNRLEFTVSGVGWKFWLTNEYSVSQLKVIGDITDLTRQKSQNTFTIKDFEFFNLDKSTLKFVPNCYQSDVSTLDIRVNNNLVFSSVPECNMLNRQDLPLGSLDAGENSIVFSTSHGTYMIDHIEVQNQLKEFKSTIYYFELNKSSVVEVQNGSREAKLFFTFVADDTSKQAIVNFNGHTASIDQTENEYSRVIPEYWLNDGNNYIKITPRSVLNVVSVEVQLNKK